MNFSDIRKMSRANYHIDVPWSYLVKQLDSFSKDCVVNLDPPYQRGYVWSDQQKTDYIEFRLKGGMRSLQIK